MTARLLPTVLGAATLAALATPAIAAPGPGQVELRNDANARVGKVIAGPDAIQVAERRARTGSLRRRADTRRWTIVVGRGTYGDFAVLEPNLTVRPVRGAKVVISGTGGQNNTRGGCIDVMRGGVAISGLRCTGAPGVGIQVGPKPGARGIVLRRMVVDGARGAGISVDRVGAVLIERPAVTGAKGDGIRLSRLTGTGPYRIAGGTIRRSGDDGVDLVRDVDGLTVSGLTSEANGGSGIESDHVASLGLSVTSSVLIRNRGHGAALARGRGHAVSGSQISGNRGYGVTVGRGGPYRLDALRFNGTNGAGDLRFSPHARTGGSFNGLAFLDTAVTLPGDPSGVVLSSLTAAQRANLSPIPTTLQSPGRFVRVKDTGGGATSAVTLRFGLAGALGGLRASGLAVYEDDPPANARTWQAQPTAPLAADASLDIALADNQIASGSDKRFAVYGPLAPPDVAPIIASVQPRPGKIVRGRNVQFAIRFADDDALQPRSFRLVVDGKVRRGAKIVKGKVRFRTRLKVGRHSAILKVTDPAGQATIRTWNFRVRNATPTIVRRVARPRPNSFTLTRGRVVLSVPVIDDAPLVTRRTRMSVNGRRVAAKLRKGKLRAVVSLPQGKYRVVVVVRDKDGARARAAWTFRTVRP